MKVALLLERYLNEYAETNICSVERARSCVRSLSEHLGRYDHTRLTAGVLRTYRQKDQLAPASINREFSVLRASLLWAQAQGLVKTVPAIPKRAGANQRVVWLRPAEVDRLLEAAKNYAALRYFILLCLLTGQRKEAILSLRWSQVDRSQRVVWFGDHGLTHAERRKGRGSVPISAGLEPLLDELANDSPFVLVNSRGTRFQDINIDHWREVVEAAGLEGLTPHDLRHTVATNLIRDEVPLIDVSKLLGHANTVITEKIYVQHQPQFLNNAVNRLDRLAGVA